MNSQVINLFGCSLSGFYLCFGFFYFSSRILPCRRKISLPLFLFLSLFATMLLWIKRQTSLSLPTLLLQLLLFLTILLIFQASFRKKITVYFIYNILAVCPQILCTSIFIELHNLVKPDNIYAPDNLIINCSSVEYLIIELPDILLELFLFWKISEILRQCIDYLKAVTYLQLLLPLTIPHFLSIAITIPKKPIIVLILSIIYWLACICSTLLLIRAVPSLSHQHRKYLHKKAEVKLIKKQMNDSVQLSNEYINLRKWNHDVENHIMSVIYLMEMKKYDEAKQYTDSVLSQLNLVNIKEACEKGDINYEKEI